MGREGKGQVMQQSVAASKPIQDENTAHHGGDVDAGREGKEEVMQQSIAASEPIQDENTVRHGVDADAGREGKEEVMQQSVAASEPIQDENTARHGGDADEEEVAQKDVGNAGQEGNEKADIAAFEPENENEPDEKDDVAASEPENENEPDEKDDQNEPDEKDDVAASEPENENKPDEKDDLAASKPENENKPGNDASQGKKASHDGDCDLGPTNKQSDAAEKLSENEKTPHDADADQSKKPPENEKPLSEICLDEKRRLVPPPPPLSTIMSLREKVLSWDTASQFSLFPSASPVKKPGMPKTFNPAKLKHFDDVEVKYGKKTKAVQVVEVSTKREEILGIYFQEYRTTCGDDRYKISSTDVSFQIPFCDIIRRLRHCVPHTSVSYARYKDTQVLFHGFP